MANPVEIIRLTGARIARLAALRMCVCAIGPAVTAFVLAALLYPIGAVTWTRWGYMLTPDRAEAIFVALLAAGAIALVAGAAMAYRDYRRANDFMGAAGMLDQLLEGDEQIVTLATLADPSAPETVKGRRTPLFPVLWRRAIAYFEGFDPVREFRFEAGEPIRRSSILAGLVAGAMVLATLGLMQAPSPEQAIAGKLRAIANEIASSASSSEDSALASKIRAAADAIENPKVPPEQKKERIKEAMQQADKAAQKRNNSASGKDQGTGTSKSSNGSGNSKGQGQSKAEGNGGGGGEGKSGTGEGKGEGKSGSGKGAGSGNSASSKNEPGTKGSDKNEKNGNKGNQQDVELQNELTKADAQVETAGAKNPGSGDDKQGKDKDQPNPNQPGSNPNQKGPDPSKPNPDMAGNLPKPGEHGDRNIPGGGKADNGKDRGSNQGDTHLGETPTGVNAQRYLKPGEKGATLDIKDARYVMFRIPSATPSGDGGKTVLDTGRPKATTAYVNAPLAPSSDNAPPDERQLVPPRYRNMIN